MTPAVRLLVTGWRAAVASSAWALIVPIRANFPRPPAWPRVAKPAALVAPAPYGPLRAFANGRAALRRRWTSMPRCPLSCRGVFSAFSAGHATLGATQCTSPPRLRGAAMPGV